MKPVAAICLLSLLAAPVSAQTGQGTAETRETHCQAIARVVWGDNQGRLATIDGYKARQDMLTPAEQRQLANMEAKYADGVKLFEALRQLYASAPKPSQQTMDKLRNDTPFSEILREAAGCLN